MGIKEKGAEGGIEVEYLFRSLMGIVARLRSPEGCPWDRRQTIPDAARYLVGETYEVLDAVENGDPDGLKEELGDLLFQILFISRLAEEERKFDTVSVIKSISEKMVRRHPHVFGDKKVLSVEDVYMKIFTTHCFSGMCHSVMRISLDRDFYIRGLHGRGLQFVVPS